MNHFAPLGLLACVFIVWISAVVIRLLSLATDELFSSIVRTGSRKSLNYYTKISERFNFLYFTTLSGKGKIRYDSPNL